MRSVVNKSAFLVAVLSLAAVVLVIAIAVSINGGYWYVGLAIVGFSLVVLGMTLYFRRLVVRSMQSTRRDIEKLTKALCAESSASDSLTRRIAELKQTIDGLGYEIKRGSKEVSHIADSLSIKIKNQVDAVALAHAELLEELRNAEIESINS